MPQAARRARESAPGARRTSARGRGAVRKTYTVNLAFDGPVFTVPPRGTNKNGVKCWGVVCVWWGGVNRYWVVMCVFSHECGLLLATWRPGDRHWRPGDLWLLARPATSGR
eukprot:4670302-Prymnesium_polylepis.1